MAFAADLVDGPGPRSTGRKIVTIGFVGLGQMGKPMALNLTKPPGTYIVYARRSDHFAEFADRGVHATTRAADLADVSVLFLSLPSTSAVNEVLFGSDGIAKRLQPGALVVDTSTVSYGATVEIGKTLRGMQISFIDAPVSGMQARAEDGTLTIMCGGSETDLERVRPLLEKMGNNILYMGATGAGQLTKLINQLLFDINAAAIAEVLPMAVKMGLDPEKVGSVVNSGTGKSYASEFFIPRILNSSFSDGYPMKHAYKDLVSAAELSAANGIPMPVLAAATATYQQALLRGYGDHDKGGMIRVFEDLLGVSFRKANCQTN
jgi:3-hydroxyisobutyrate dehydrogenase-like beta-hydroxyacid dehydrogenase